MLARWMVVALVVGASVGSGGAAGAVTPVQLLVPQSTAFGILGHSCGGIQEQAFATGFDPASGFPVGDVHLQTTCSTGGRGSKPVTYAAWVSATWDYTGAFVSSVVLSATPAVDPTFSAFDAYGNEVYNASNNAYLVLSPTFVPAPRVTGISPAEGPGAGGTTVTVTGTGFTAATSVAFGATPAASFTVTSDTSISAVSPAAAAGTVDVTVTSPGGTSATATSDQFTFVATPVVSAVSPRSGLVTGGAAVQIGGSGFTQATAVYFGDMAAGFTVDSDASITATAPAADSPGAVDVRVVSLAGTSATSAADQYTYLAYVQVTPTSGPPATGVAVSGGGFNPGETVRVFYQTGLSSPSPAWVPVCSALSPNGSFTCLGSIPGASTAGALGAHRLVARGSTSLVTALTTFTLT